MFDYFYYRLFTMQKPIHGLAIHGMRIFFISRMFGTFFTPISIDMVHNDVKYLFKNKDRLILNC